MSSIFELTTSETLEVSGAYSISAFNCTLSNGGNNANSWYQAGVWGAGSAGVAALTTRNPYVILGSAAIGGATGFVGSMTLTCK